MKKVSIIGHYAFGLKYNDGQTIKTKIISNEICYRFGQNEVKKIDTHGKFKTFLCLPFKIFFAFLLSKNILFLPAHNGLKIYMPLIVFLNNIFNNKKTHYIVIGGWLPSVLKKNKRILKNIKKIDCVYVETKTMKKELENLGLNNIYIMPNCKKLNIVNEVTNIDINNPLKLCIFSRIMKEKGIVDAINVVQCINKLFSKIVFTLDIYGPIDHKQIDWFENIKKNFPQYIHYNGCVDSNQSVNYLKSYYALLFPTHFFTEGIPGTILDAYAAGIPVISSKWESFSDIIDDGITGFGYNFNDFDELKLLMIKIANNPSILLKMREECVKKATDYTPNKVLNILVNNLI